MRARHVCDTCSRRPEGDEDGNLQPQENGCFTPTWLFLESAAVMARFDNTSLFRPGVELGEI